jgi:parallel beta-helix repeat protein
LATLSGNDISVGASGLAILDLSSDRTIISGNVLSSAGQVERGIVAVGAAAKTVQNDYITAAGASGLGIELEAGEGDTVTGNTIDGAQLGIAFVTGNTVRGNTFFNVVQLTTP